MEIPRTRNSYAFADMKLGEWLKFDDREDFKRAVSAAGQRTKRTGETFVSRWQGLYGVIWRVESSEGIEGIPKRKIFRPNIGVETREPREISFFEWIEMIIGDYISISNWPNFEEYQAIMEMSAAGEGKEYSFVWNEETGTGRIERIN